MTLDQARAASERALGELDLIGLRMHMESPLLVLTHGHRGALVIHRRGLRWAPAEGAEYASVPRGAGDSFSAAAALALRATSDPVQAAEFGNLVASITIMKGCLAPASAEEVRKRASEPQITHRSVPVDRIPQHRGPGQ
jgi:sugar/nucleoside kinase (ribokinase family)